LQDVEFIKYLGYVASTGSIAPTEATVETYTGSETTVDWTGVFTTSVKDQGYCSSCWAFTAAEQLESDAIRLLGLSTSDLLSTQQLVSCDSADGGCNGGDPQEAFEYAIENGLVLESAYAYTSTSGESGSCDSSNTDYLVSVSSYSTISGDDATTVETSMIDYVLGTGPLAVCIDASTWSSYVSGIVSVSTSTINHCAQVVGVSTSDGYWKVRNSWGSSWGESGYIYLMLNTDMCGITSMPSFTTPTLSGTTASPSMAPILSSEPSQAPTEAPTEATITSLAPTEAPSEGTISVGDDWDDVVYSAPPVDDDDWDDDA